MKDGTMRTIDELNRLTQILACPQLPSARHEWGGADVVITPMPPPEESEPGFYPEPRYVLTPYSLELSLLFEKLRDAFYAEERIDGASKIEFFGRLANAANGYRQHATGPTSAHHLCAAVLHEAFAIYDEMEEGSFEGVAIAMGNEIADDYVDEAPRNGFIGIEATLAFFRNRGVEVGND